MERRDEDATTPRADEPERVGLGHVVSDRRPGSAADADARASRDPRADRDSAGGTGDDVQESSEESFPASDPPTFMSDKATPADGAQEPSLTTRHVTDGEKPIELPAPRDVP